MLLPFKFSIFHNWGQCIKFPQLSCQLIKVFLFTVIHDQSRQSIVIVDKLGHWITHVSISLPELDKLSIIRLLFFRSVAMLIWMQRQTQLFILVINLLLGGISWNHEHAIEVDIDSLEFHGIFPLITLVIPLLITSLLLLIVLHFSYRDIPMNLNWN